MVEVLNLRQSLRPYEFEPLLITCGECNNFSLFDIYRLLPGAVKFMIAIFKTKMSWFHYTSQYCIMTLSVDLGDNL